jgi:hypothetical protein
VSERVTEIEAPGSFYLGRAVDLDAPVDTEAVAAERAPVLYASRDLVTHAVCIGMTGSGKTGLCVAMIEEAALDGVPAIVIDPKGDLGNLLLTFPDLAPADFRPWVDESEAARRGITVDALAAHEAERWKAGLAAWGEDGARIARLRAAADFTVFTPGSTAGLPISILASFAAPDAETREDPELLGERAGAAAGALLGLLGVDADPLKSREHVLLSTILHGAWKAGEDLDVARIVERIQAPTFARVGVLDLESFFPAKARFELAMKLNHLLASPAFATWLEGDPLDVGRLLRVDDGRPRVSVVSIAHLADAERMFFVTMLLHAVIAWMRRQSGTSSLRALVCMDEVAGWMPPVANPPSKAPLLTLLKQGRAFGVGLLLATQNPVDLDYKGLSNAGTWLLGRLQTERDKARVLDGLLAVAGGGGGPRFERAQLERDLGRLRSRVFLLHDVHRAGPEVFEARWAMSYLRGPLTRAQIKTLMHGRRTASLAPAAPPAIGRPQRPMLPPSIPQVFVPGSDGGALVPHVLIAAHVRWVDVKAGIDHTEDVVVALPFGDGAAPVRWDAARPLGVKLVDLQRDPPTGGTFAELPPPATVPTSWTAWRREAQPWLARTWRLPLWRHAASGLVSRPGEREGDFRSRLFVAAREQRDAALEAARAKAAPKRAALEEKRRKAAQRIEREEGQVKQEGIGAALAMGSTVIGALLGSKATRGVTAAVRGAGRAATQAADVKRAREDLAGIDAALTALDQETRAAIEKIVADDPARAPLEVKEVRAKKADVAVQLVALGWVAAATGRAPLAASPVV